MKPTRKSRTTPAIIVCGAIENVPIHARSDRSIGLTESGNGFRHEMSLAGLVVPQCVERWLVRANRSHPAVREEMEKATQVSMRPFVGTQVTERSPGSGRRDYPTVYEKAIRNLLPVGSY